MSSRLEILETLSAHLGQGRMDGPAQERLHRLSALLSYHAGGQGGLLWRAIILSGDQADDLRAGRGISLEPRDFECWSRSRGAVRYLLRLRASQAWDQSRQDGSRYMAVLCARPADPADCLIDVEAFYRAEGPQHMTGGSWFYYAGREQEVILRVPGGVPRIDPQDLMEMWDVSDPSLYDPEVGDTFLFRGDEEYVIEELIGPNDCGCFEVRVGDMIYPLIMETTHFDLGGPTRQTPSSNCEEITP
ncbi:hypothetical protein KUV57_12430 [Epibacterium sp. DP7N7-1]|nr:hypothetical protein [Epibacterium sp. DP7N7-1]